jgi:hypothetical protein
MLLIWKLLNSLTHIASDAARPAPVAIAANRAVPLEPDRPDAGRAGNPAPSSVAVARLPLTRLPGSGSPNSLPSGLGAPFDERLSTMHIFSHPGREMQVAVGHPPFHGRLFDRESLSFPPMTVVPAEKRSNTLA